MSKVAVVYWSGTGNTKIMAEEVAKGAEAAGAEVVVLSPSKFDAGMVDQLDGIAFGCPSMGVEVLEEGEFDPMFESCESRLKGKKIALFGSYGWGDGEWMRNWEERCRAVGADFAADFVIANEEPDEQAKEECRALGKALA